MAHSQSFFDLMAPNLLLVNASPSMDNLGIILHLREVEGAHTHLDIHALLQQTGAVAASEVNVLEEEIKKLDGEIHVHHFQTLFIKLSFD